MNQQPRFPVNLTVLINRYGPAAPLNYLQAGEELWELRTREQSELSDRYVGFSLGGAPPTANEPSGYIRD